MTYFFDTFCLFEMQIHNHTHISNRNANVEYAYNVLCGIRVVDRNSKDACLNNVLSEALLQSVFIMFFRDTRICKSFDECICPKCLIRYIAARLQNVLSEKRTWCLHISKLSIMFYLRHSCLHIFKLMHVSIMFYQIHCCMSP